MKYLAEHFLATQTNLPIEGSETASSFMSRVKRRIIETKPAIEWIFAIHRLEGLQCHNLPCSKLGAIGFSRFKSIQDDFQISLVTKVYSILI